MAQPVSSASSHSIPGGIEKPGIGQGGSQDFLAGAKCRAREHGTSEDEKSGAKPTLHQNRFFNHERYNHFSKPVIRNWELFAKAIAEVAFEILLPFVVCLMLYSVLPVTLSAVVVPMAALGLSFSAAFLFLGGGGAFPTAPVITLPEIPLKSLRDLPRSNQSSANLPV